MNFLRTINLLYRLHKSIQQKATGTPDELAKRLHLEKRQLYNLLRELRKYGAEIRYDRADCTFFYVNNFELIDKTSIGFLSGKEEKPFLQEILKIIYSAQ